MSQIASNSDTYTLTRVNARPSATPQNHALTAYIIQETHPLTRVHANTSTHYPRDFAEDAAPEENMVMEEDVAVEELGTLALTTVDSVHILRRNTDESKASSKKGKKRWWRRLCGKKSRKEEEEIETEEMEGVVDVAMPNFRRE
jgi:hypothetical protein